MKTQWSRQISCGGGERASGALVMALVLTVAVCVTLTGPLARGESDARRPLMKGAIIPIFLREQRKPALVIRIDRMSKEYQRKGFFRIGLLPHFVAEGVTFEFLNPTQTIQSLREARTTLFACSNGSAIELRRVAVRLEARGGSILEARSLRFDATGQWHFTDGTLKTPHGEAVHFSNATLQASGPSAGQLWIEAGDRTIAVNLLIESPPE